MVPKLRADVLNFRCFQRTQPNCTTFTQLFAKLQNCTSQVLTPLMRFQTSHKANVYLTENWLYSCTRELFFGMEAQLSIRKAWGQKKKEKKRGQKRVFWPTLARKLILVHISAHFVHIPALLLHSTQFLL